jgi:hypothetical protein
MSSHDTQRGREIGYADLESGQAAVAEGRPDDARRRFDSALEAFGLADSKTGQAQAEWALRTLAATQGDLAEAREHHVAAVAHLEAAVARDPAARPVLGFFLLQLARADALAGRPDAEATFRSALRVASEAADRSLRGTIWHYLGAWCERRALPVAGLLAHQESFDAVPEDADAAAAPRRLLDDPGGRAQLREDVLARARAALPDFARRFEAGEVSLADTASAVLPRAPTDGSLADGLSLLETAIAQGRAWHLDAEDTFRAALRALADSANAGALAYGWSLVGAYLIARAQPAGALLAYDLALRWAESAGDANRANGALYGAAYALSDLGEWRAQLAAGALLERRGALNGLPTTDQLLASESPSSPQLRELHRTLLDDDSACRQALAESIARAAREHPDFERRFVAGEERFDTPERLFALMGEGVRNPTLRETGDVHVRRIFRRRLVVRTLGPAVALAIACAGVLALGAASWPWPLQAALCVAALLSVALWLAHIRPIYRLDRLAQPNEADRFIDRHEREASTHAEAYAVVEQFIRSRAPFALYLRSFEIEAGEIVRPNAGPNRHSPGLAESDQMVVTNLGGHSRVDTYLSERLAPQLPVIGVLNPAATVGLSGPVPRLQLSNDNWALSVRLLISAAHLIVVECVALAPGLVTEVELVQNRERAADTIIVLPSSETVDDVMSTRQLAGLSSGGDYAGPPIATAGAEALQAFERVVDEEWLLARDPGELDAFRGLLPVAAPTLRA